MHYKWIYITKIDFRGTKAGSSWGKFFKQLVSANDRRMTIDIELLLARFPRPFFRREGGVKGFHSGGILTAGIRVTGNKLPPLTAKSVWNQLANQQSRWEMTLSKADIFLFAAHKSTTHIVGRIAEIDVHIIAKFTRPCK